MKITIYISSLAGGGAERVVCNLASHLASSGHDVKIITNSEKQSYELNPRVNHVILYNAKAEKYNFLIRNAMRLLRLRKAVESDDAEVYLSFLPWPNFMLMHFRRIISVPVIISERSDPRTFCGERKNLKRVLKYYSRADAYVFQTSDSKEYYLNDLGFKGKKYAVIPNAINREFICEPWTGEKQKLIIGAGRLTAQKNFPLLIRAFAGISADFPEYKLEIYGTGALKSELEALVIELGLEGKVRLMGYVSDIKERMQKASLFVLSSDYEGMPNVLAEAMALGTACISTDCPAGGSKYLINDGENGIIVPVGDENKLSEAIRLVLADAEFRKKLEINAREVVNRLSPEKIYSDWERFIIDVASNNSK